MKKNLDVVNKLCQSLDPPFMHRVSTVLCMNFKNLCKICLNLLTCIMFDFMYSTLNLCHFTHCEIF